jgi:uncharacterized protein DUF6962
MYVTQIIQPDITLLGLRIQEPMIVLTDIILGLVCFYAYSKLSKSGSRANSLMKYYFLVFGISAIVGGVLGHGFIYALDFSWKLAGWVPAILSVLLLEFAALEHARAFLNTKALNNFKAINILVTVVTLTLTIYYVNFKFVEMHSAYGILVVFLPLHILIYRKTKNPGSKFMIYSVIALFSTLFVFRIPIVIHTYFNHLDLAHLIIGVTVLLMLKGTRLYNRSELTSSI